MSQEASDSIRVPATSTPQGDTSSPQTDPQANPQVQHEALNHKFLDDDDDEEEDEEEEGSVFHDAESLVLNGGPTPSRAGAVSSEPETPQTRRPAMLDPSDLDNVNIFDNPLNAAAAAVVRGQEDTDSVTVGEVEAEAEVDPNDTSVVSPLGTETENDATEQEEQFEVELLDPKEEEAEKNNNNVNNERRSIYQGKGKPRASDYDAFGNIIRTEGEQLYASEGGDIRDLKVAIKLQATGGAPILDTTLFYVNGTQKLQSIASFIRKSLKMKAGNQLFVYVNSSFAPSPDETIDNLYRTFGTNSTLVVNYAVTPAWG